jgi:hypothetical protein
MAEVFWHKVFSNLTAGRVSLGTIFPPKTLDSSKCVCVTPID